jgi:hypothetical protein
VHPPPGHDVRRGPARGQQDQDDRQDRPGGAGLRVDRPDEHGQGDHGGAGDDREHDADETHQDGDPDEDDYEIDDDPPGVTRAWPAGASAAPGRGAVLLHEAVRLVVDLDGDDLERVGVPTRVVGAEEELAAGEDHSDVRLRAATVAAIGCGQRSGCRRGHGSM